MRIHIHNALSFCQLGQRDHQEDARWPENDQANDSQRFFLVCDGVGGNAKGEVASNTVCHAFARAMKRMQTDPDFSNAQLAEVLNDAYTALDRMSDDENEGMATTLTFLCLHGTGATMAHIGDSRIYHIRPSEGILYRSDDHSLVNSMVHNGVVTPEEGSDHPQQNVITRYMEAVDKEHFRHLATVMRTDDIQPGDCFFLCTDGVAHCVGDDDLLSILTDTDTDENAKMVEMARRCVDSPDNNTAWLIFIDKVEGAQPRQERPFTEQPATKRMSVPRKGTTDVEPHAVTKKSNWFKRFFS